MRVGPLTVLPAACTEPVSGGGSVPVVPEIVSGPLTTLSLNSTPPWLSVSPTGAEIVLPAQGPVAASPPTSTRLVLPVTDSGPDTVLPQIRTTVDLVVVWRNELICSELHHVGGEAAEKAALRPCDRSQQGRPACRQTNEQGHQRFGNSPALLFAVEIRGPQRRDRRFTIRDGEAIAPEIDDRKRQIVCGGREHERVFLAHEIGERMSKRESQRVRRNRSSYPFAACSFGNSEFISRTRNY